MTMSESGKKSFPLAFLIVILTFVILMSVIILSLNEFARVPAGSAAADEIPRFNPDMSFDMLSLSGGSAVPDFGSSVLEARQALIDGKDARAGEILRDLVLFYPRAALPRRMLADIFVSHGDFEAAEQLLAPLLAGREDRSDLLYDYALVLGVRGKFDAAAYCMDRAFRLNPALADALIYLTYFHLKNSRRKEAVSAFAEACRRLGPVVRRFEFDDDYRAFLQDRDIAEMLRNLPAEKKEGPARE